MTPKLTNTFIIHPNGMECYIKINCTINITSNTYAINYKYEFPNTMNTLKKQISLLKLLELYDKDLEEPYDGDIIHKNSLSEQLVRYLTMSDEELSKVCGNVHHENYRINIIKSIQLLWD